MKTFIWKTVLFSILIVVFIESVSLILIYTNLYLINYPGREVYISIKKSKKKSDTRTLLLGDSVCQQLFPNDNDDDEINSLACNQAIGIVGHFFLLNNYLKVGNKVDKVIMLFSPSSFMNNLDQVFTYHYFLKPFYNSEYSPLFSTTVMEQVEKIPYHQFASIPHILATSWAPEIDALDQNHDEFLSPVSIEYLSRINDLSMEHGFELVILPVPMSIEEKVSVENLKINGVSKHNLQQQFENYFAKITYLDSSEFMDGTHLIHPEKYIEMYQREFGN